MARCKVITPVFSGEVEALCLASPICDVIIGNIPGVNVDIQGNIDTSDEVEDNEQVPAEMLKSELPKLLWQMIWTWRAWLRLEQ